MPALAIALASKARNSPDILKIIEMRLQKDTHIKSRNLILKENFYNKIKRLIKKKHESN